MHAANSTQEKKRLKVLWEYEVLDTVPEELFDELTELAARICEAPIALISLVDEKRQWFKSRVGLDVTETSRDISFCAHAIKQPDLFIIPDAALDPRFADNPLVTIGAHSITHCNLAQQSEADAKQELTVGRARIEAALHRPVVHLAYPYGDRNAAGAREFALAAACGYKTAVTTRPGMVFPESAAHLTALPRVSLNGNYQDARILPVLTSGAATAMWNGFRRVDAA